MSAVIKPAVFNETAMMMSSHEDRAINYALQYSELRDKTILAAICCGLELIEVKKSLKHGEFMPWVKKNMPVCPDQCNKFIKLAESHGYLNYDSSRNLKTLDLDSEVILLAFNIDDANVLRDAVKGEPQSKANPILRDHKNNPAESAELIKAIKENEAYRIKVKQQNDLLQELTAELEREKETTVSSMPSKKELELKEQLKRSEKEKSDAAKKAKADYDALKLEREESRKISVKLKDKAFSLYQECEMLKAQLAQGGNADAIKKMQKELVRKENELIAAQRQPTNQDTAKLIRKAELQAKIDVQNKIIATAQSEIDRLTTELNSIK